MLSRIHSSPSIASRTAMFLTVSATKWMKPSEPRRFDMPHTTRRPSATTFSGSLSTMELAPFRPPPPENQASTGSRVPPFTGSCSGCVGLCTLTVSDVPFGCDAKSPSNEP
eukprot:1141223-Prymnesium_polylepis.1